MSEIGQKSKAPVTTDSILDEIRVRTNNDLTQIGQIYTTIADAKSQNAINSTVRL